jgi:RNA 2',3'-cyclic 3'-phosphodiesterase
MEETKEPMKDTFRTFVAVETGDAVRKRAVELIKSLGAAGADVKWVERHNLHMTLKFLDEVPSREIARVCEAVAQAAGQQQPFELEIRGAGAFPSAGRPRTVWLGAGEGQELMIALQGRIDAALKQLGFRKEPRRFEPHLTIGRVRGGGPSVAALGQLLGQQAEFDAGRFLVSEVVVFSSELTREGPIYEALGRAELGK